mmetsp:Transcript_36567/g.84528  ORF Transcript_36567/g.84528 Transcript_36567/m.84528 type:complete len:131 (-) Transcript_36567:147-539(-)
MVYKNPAEFDNLPTGGLDGDFLGANAEFIEENHEVKSVVPLKGAAAEPAEEISYSVLINGGTPSGGEEEICGFKDKDEAIAFADKLFAKGRHGRIAVEQNDGEGSFTIYELGESDEEPSSQEPSSQGTEE